MSSPNLPIVDSDSLLPANALPAHPPAQLTGESQLKEAKAADVQFCNDILTTYYYAFPKAQSISSLTKLGDATLRALEARRKVLCLQYGSKSENSRRDLFEDAI